LFYRVVVGKATMQRKPRSDCRLRHVMCGLFLNTGLTSHSLSFGNCTMCFRRVTSFFSNLFRCAEWKEHTAFIHFEGKGNMFLQNSGIHLPDHRVINKKA